MTSILSTIKKMLGIDPTYTHFDVELILYINSVFAILNQMGVGPEEGFRIHNDVTTWSDYIDDDENLDFVISYVYLRVKMMFDPASSSYLNASAEKIISELEWRLAVKAENNSLEE